MIALAATAQERARTNRGLTQHQLDCRAAAYQWHEWGANVTAVRKGGKGPAHVWKGGTSEKPGPDWTKARQTTADVADLPWHNAGGIGVVNGPGGFRTLDLDKCPSDAPARAFCAGADLPADYPHVGPTGSGNGWRVAFICHEALPTHLLESGILSAPPRNPGDFDHVELRWKDCQTVMPPSAYTFSDGAPGPGYRYVGEAPTEPPAVLTADQVIAGFLAIAQLPEQKPVQRIEKAIQPQPKTYVKTHNAPQHRANGSIDTPAIGRATRTKFNEEHALDTLIESYGAVETDPGYYSCPCGVPHENKNTLNISKQGKLFSLSPRCNWHTKQGWDAFGLYVLVEHNNNYSAAREAKAKEYGLWQEPQPRQRRDDPPTPTDAPEWQTTAAAERRRKAAQRKRKERQEAAQHLRDDILGRAAVDEDMPAQSRQLLDIHLSLVGQRGWHRASVARMAEMAGYGERWVQRFNEYLVEQKYIQRTQPDPTNTAVWTLQGSKAERAATPKVAVDRVIGADDVLSERSPEYISSKTLDQTLELVSAPPTPADCAPELDVWEAADDGHGADELVFLDAEPVVLPEPQEPPADPNAPPAGEGDYSTQEIHYADGRIGWRLWDDRTNTLLGEYPTMDMAIAAIATQAEPDLDGAEIDRMVTEIQAVADARRQERQEPRAYWDAHEARAWREAHPVQPESPAMAVQRLAKVESGKARLRAKWDDMTPGQLGRALGILRNRVKSHPKDLSWAGWQICELNERLAAVTPVEDGNQVATARALTSSPPVGRHVAQHQALMFGAAP
jgi:hypothetical protein